MPNIWPSGQVTGKPRYEIIPNLISGFDFHSASRRASRDQQRLARFHHCLAIETRIEGGEFVPFIGIAVRFARYKNLDVWGLDFHDQSRGNVDDLGNDVDDLLPFLNEFKGYLDDCG